MLHTWHQSHRVGISESAPAAKKPKRLCEWQPEWKSYGKESKKALHTSTVAHVVVISQLLVLASVGLVMPQRSANMSRIQR